MTTDEIKRLLGDLTFCFWLDKDGKPCPKCGKLHIPRPPREKKVD